MLNKIISFHTAAKGILIILSIILVFHALVLTGFIPFDIVWGGRLKSRGDMLVFESVSVGLNLLIVLVIAGHAGYLPLLFNKNISRILIWLMTGLFLLNTIGNLMALNPVEKFIFTPLTLVLTMLCYRVADEKT
ncbi:MAG TPA: hypothetical protein VK202_02655 [Bacteroidia bacterium]|nr:hypothetical protein [Bacteroidia bacterium]